MKAFPQISLFSILMLAFNLSLPAQIGIFGEVYNAPGSNLSIKGNLYHLGQLIDSSQVYLSGSAKQRIQGDSTLILNQLIIDNSSIEGIDLELEVQIGAQLEFSDGILNYGTNGKLVFLDNAQSTGANNASHVNAKVWKIGNDSFEFPTGAQGRFAPIYISAPSTLTAEFSAEYIHDAASINYDTSLKESGISKIKGCEYWELEQTKGNSSIKVELSWKDDRSCSISDINRLLVSSWNKNDSIWENLGSDQLNGDASSGSVMTNTLIDTFGPFAIARGPSNNQSLPITLDSFWGNCSNGVVELNWISLQEVNNMKYVIEKSKNGQKWINIKNVAGAANSSSPIKYSLKDPAPFSGSNYYRLKQVDFDGSSTYFEPISIKGCSDPEAGLKIFPNPTTGIVNISLASRTDRINSIKLYSAQGQLLINTDHRSSLNLSGFNSGSYFLMINTDLGIFKERVILQ